MNNKLNQLWKEYQDVPIPEELTRTVNKAISQSLKVRRVRSAEYRWFVGITIAVLVFLYYH